jgi:hypothetical protein
MSLLSAPSGCPFWGLFLYVCYICMYKAIAVCLQEAWGIRNAYKYVTIVADASQSAYRTEARGQGHRCCLGHEW